MEEAKKESTIFDEFVSNTLIFYLIIILIGYLSTISYYKIFGIYISSFFTIDDFVSVLFDNLFLLIFYILFYSIAIPIGRDYTKNIILSDRYRKKFSIIIQIIFISSSTVCFILLLLYHIINNIDYLFFLSILLAFPLFSGLILYVEHLESFKLIKFSKDRRTFTLLILAFAYIMFFNKFSNGCLQYDSKTNKQKMVFYLNTGATIKTSDETLYLGGSTDYIFLYYKPQNRAIIYNKSTITSIDIISNRKK